MADLRSSLAGAADLRSDNVDLRWVGRLHDRRHLDGGHYGDGDVGPGPWNKIAPSDSRPDRQKPAEMLARLGRAILPATQPGCAADAPSPAAHRRPAVLIERLVRLLGLGVACSAAVRCSASSVCAASSRSRSASARCRSPAIAASARSVLVVASASCASAVQMSYPPPSCVSRPPIEDHGNAVV